MASSLIPVLTDLAMIFGPVVGYIPQYRNIKEIQHIEGFSTKVCLILLTSNILRVFFWYGKRFSVVLLLQSFVMIFAQLMLLRLCTRVEARHKLAHFLTKTIFESPIKSFWAWDDFFSYVVFLSGFTGVTAVTTLIFRNSEAYFDLLGLLSVTIEASLGVPQLLMNYKKKNTAGLSLAMIMSWFLGDGLKTLFFLMEENTPMQFILCGITQLTVDLLILGQMFIYRNKPKQ